MHQESEWPTSVQRLLEEDYFAIVIFQTNAIFFTLFHNIPFLIYNVIVSVVLYWHREDPPIEYEESCRRPLHFDGISNDICNVFYILFLSPSYLKSLTLPFLGFYSPFLYRRFYRCNTSLDAFSFDNRVLKARKVLTLEDFNHARNETDVVGCKFLILDSMNYFGLKPLERMFLLYLEKFTNTLFFQFYYVIRYCVSFYLLAYFLLMSSYI